VQNKQKEWLDFFYTVDGNDVQNVGWPRYARSTRDTSVILRLIPAGPGNPEPFYMATREITNAQYRNFLEKTAAKNSIRLAGWAKFTDQDNKTLIYSTIRDKPPCAIKWDASQNTFEVSETDADVPVTWVTYYGANAYAEWLGAWLPAASQHKYASSAGTYYAFPWGNDLSQIADYAHVRAAAWQKAAQQYNSEKDRIVPPLPIPPLGAVKDLAGDKTLDTTKVVINESSYDSVWPIAHARKPNPWGLHDMIGNVWEWCKNDNDATKPLICGGSCLSPPEYVRTDSQYQFDVDRACDVGFRVIVPAVETNSAQLSLPR
jgi:formylglycine-generating enzyme required for sulfatase activity